MSTADDRVEQSEAQVETEATYDLIAPAYAARQRARDPADPAREVRRLLAGLASALAPSARVGDLGCGPAHDSAWLAGRRLRVVGVDRSAGMLARASPPSSGDRLTLVRGDLCDLPLASASLDGAWSSYALLHVPRERLPRALAEIARCLRSGAPFALATAGGDGEMREEVAYSPGLYRTFVLHRLPAFTAACRLARLDVASGGQEDSAHRGLLWVTGSRRTSTD